MTLTSTRKRSRRGFGAVRKLPSGMWQASYLGPDRKRHTAPTTFQSKIDAEAYLALTQSKIIERKWKPEEPAQKSLTLRQYAEPWLADRQLKPRTRVGYRSLLDRRILPQLGDRPLVSLTPADIRGWHAQQGDHTPTARAEAYGLLRTILTGAVEDGLILSNPCHIEPATLEQIELIIDRLPDRFGLMVQLATWCALRFGEVTELRRGDLDLKNGRLHVRRAVAWVRGTPVVGTPKSAAGMREVAIPPHLLPAVRMHLVDHVEWGKDALLFPAVRAGGHLSHGTLHEMWVKARKVAGRDDLRFHDLRHTGAVMAAQSGATIAELMARLGHTTPTMALKYQHASQDRDAEIARRLSQMVVDPSHA
jgi:integrase